MHEATGSTRFSLAIQRIGWSGPVDQVASFEPEDRKRPIHGKHGKSRAKTIDFTNQFLRTHRDTHNGIVASRSIFLLQGEILQGVEKIWEIEGEKNDLGMIKVWIHKRTHLTLLMIFSYVS